MKKLKLDLDELTVASFEIDNTGGSRGTVQGALAEATDYCSVSCGDPLSSMYIYTQMLLTY